MTERLKTTVIEGVSSPAFLEAAFRCYAEGRLFTVRRAGLDLADYPGLEVVQSLPAAAGSGWCRLAHRPGLSEAPQQILFSSGTEGRPKAVVLSQRNLADVTARLNAAMGLDAGVREYIGVPVTYSFGLGRARAVAAAGGACFLPERFDPAEIGRMLAAGEINAISAVPSLWRLVLANPGLIGAAGDRVRWIEIGSQYMAREEKAAMKRLFPQARIVQHYGLTEASRTTFLDISATEGEALATVGHATGSVRLRIGAEGEICIRGDHVALGLLGDDGGIRPLTDADGWLHTRDRGEIGPDGALTYLGRLDDQINVAGIKLSAEPLEQEVARLAGGAGRFALAAVPDPLRGDAVLLALAPGADAAALEAAAAEVLRRHKVNPRGSLHVRRVAELPLTATGKVQRNRLRQDFAAQAPAAPPGGAPAGDVAGVFRSHFPGVEVQPDDCFNGLGGDSLNYTAVMLDLEALLGDLPRGWERMTVAELSAAARPAGGGGWFSSWVSADAPTILRGLAIIMVLVGHFEIYDYGRGGALLMLMIAGYNLAAFQLDAVLRSGSVRPLLVLCAKVAVPTLAYLVLLGLVFGTFEWHTLALVSNWIDPFVNKGFNYWFIEVYVQILVVLALVLSLPAVRAFLAPRLPQAALAFLAAATVLYLVTDALWNTDHLFRRLPHLLLWLFAAGVAAAVVRTRGQRLAVAALFVLAWDMYEISGLQGLAQGRIIPEESMPFLLVFGLLLVWNPPLRLPVLLRRVLSEISAASLFIYLTHYQFRSAVQNVAETPAVVHLLVALAGGVALYRIYALLLARGAALWRRAQARRLGEMTDRRA